MTIPLTEILKYPQRLGLLQSRLQTIGIPCPQMILVVRPTTFAWDVYDGRRSLEVGSPPTLSPLLRSLTPNTGVGQMAARETRTDPTQPQNTRNTTPQLPKNCSRAPRPYLRTETTFAIWSESCRILQARYRFSIFGALRHLIWLVQLRGDIEMVWKDYPRGKVSAGERWTPIILGTDASVSKTLVFPDRWVL